MRERARGGKSPLYCPSAPAHSKGCVIFGIVLGTVAEAAVHYLEQAVPARGELVEQSAPGTPEEVFRMAAPCVRRRCVHFRDSACGLAGRVVQHLPIVSQQLPPCAIRSECVWYAQEGAPACLRCPQIVRLSQGACEAARCAAQLPETLETQGET